MKNIRPTDRFLRALLGIAALQLGYFWLGGPASWISLALGTILVITALTGVCPLYRLPGVSPRTEKPGGPRTAFKVAAIVILAAAAVGGSYASIFFTRKIFLEDFHRHWPTDAPHTYVDFIGHGQKRPGFERMGYPGRQLGAG